MGHTFRRRLYLVLIGITLGVTIAFLINQYYARSTRTISLLSYRVGYAQYTNVTGGEGYPIYVVSSTGDSGPGTLRDAVSAGNRYVVFDETLMGQEIVLEQDVFFLEENITLDGRGVKFYITGASLKFEGTNIILSHLHFRNNNLTPITDAVTFRNAPDKGQRFFIYASTFESASDGLLDIIWNQGNDVYGTVRLCRFEKHNKAILIDSNSLPDEGGRYYITFAENYFLNLIQRTPLARRATVHMYNNLFEEFGGPDKEGGGARADTDTHLIVESSVSQPYNTGDAHWAGGRVANPALKVIGPRLSEATGLVRIEDNLLLGNSYAVDNSPDTIDSIPYLYQPAPATQRLAFRIRLQAGDPS